MKDKHRGDATELQVVLIKECLEELIAYEKAMFDDSVYVASEIGWADLWFSGVRVYIGQENKIQIIEEEFRL